MSGTTNSNVVNQYAVDFYKTISTLLNMLQATDRNGQTIDFFTAIEKSIEMILKQSNLNKKIMCIGNGASQSISSHISTDFLKNANIPAMAFTDPSLLTTISNDLGYEHVFKKPIEMLANDGDIIIAISSSGKSENILQGCKAAREKNCSIITLSGFKPDNPLRVIGDINFYVPFSEYGPVEVLHHSICHCMIDSIVKMRNS